MNRDSSFVNIPEAMQVVAILRSIEIIINKKIRDDKVFEVEELKQEIKDKMRGTIGIITPYRAQVNELKH